MICDMVQNPKDGCMSIVIIVIGIVVISFALDTFKGPSVLQAIPLVVGAALILFGIVVLVGK
jgi:hypothetical protein